MTNRITLSHQGFNPEYTPTKTTESAFQVFSLQLVYDYIQCLHWKLAKMSYQGNAVEDFSILAFKKKLDNWRECFFGSSQACFFSACLHTRKLPSVELKDVGLFCRKVTEGEKQELNTSWRGSDLRCSLGQASCTLYEVHAFHILLNECVWVFFLSF